MKKIFTALTIMLCMSMSMNAIDVDVEKEDPDPFPEDRSATATVTASLECQVLTIQFSELTSSQVIITDGLTNSTVWSDSYNPSYSVQANLASLPAGSYTVLQ